MIQALAILICCAGVVVLAFAGLVSADWGPGETEEVPDAGPNLGE